MAALIIATAGLTASHGVIFVLLEEIRRTHGFSTASLGLLAGAGFAGSLVGLLTIAPFADRGRARQMILAGLAASVALLLVVAFADDLAVIVAARFVAGMAFSVVDVAGRGVMVRHEPEHAGRNLGRLTAASMGGFVVGPAVGAGLYDHLGYEAPFVTLAGVAAVAMVLFALSGRGIPEGTPDGSPPSMLARTGLDLLAHRGVLAAALIGLAIYLPVGVYDALWARFLQDLGAGATFVGVSLTAYGLPLVLLGGPGGRLSDRFGPRRVVMVAMLGVIPLTALYGSLRAAWLVLAVAMLEAVFQAAGTPASQRAMANVCPRARAATGQGLISVLGLSGAGLLAAAAPPLYALWGPAPLFAAVAVVMGLIAAVGLRLGGSALDVAPDASQDPDGDA